MVKQAAVQIGLTIWRARLDKGYTSRASLVNGTALKNYITSEGLRKIERGERIPKLINLSAIAAVLDLSLDKLKELERIALHKNVERVAQRFGNMVTTVTIEGTPIPIARPPPNKKVENFVRETIKELVKMVEQYGVAEKDILHFQRHARFILLEKLQT